MPYVPLPTSAPAHHSSLVAFSADFSPGLSSACIQLWRSSGSHEGAVGGWVAFGQKNQEEGFAWWRLSFA